MTAPHGGEFYKRLGIKRTISCASYLTVLGGSIMPPPVLRAMEDASSWMVNMHELNAKAGEVIARFTGAEAGMVTAGAAAAMMLEAAAVMAGTDPAKRQRLPDTTGMKDEIIVQWAHRVNYDHNFRAAGAKLVEIGNNHAHHEWELEAAINENTAAVAHIFGPRLGGGLPLPKVVEIAHGHGLPVIVDAAAMLPPPENLRRYVEMGADMVCFSGGKGVLGPQSTGILCGRADLIEAAYMNSSPNNESIGRGAKICKEEIAGLITALELFVDGDHEAVTAAWHAKSEHIVSALQGIPGLKVELAEATPELDEHASTCPRALIFFERSWDGPGQDEVIQRLEDGNPSILVRPAGYTPSLAIVPETLLNGEEELVAQRLKEILTARG